MAGNDVVIHVKSDNDTRGGFDGARKESKKFSDDLIKDGKKAGEEIAKVGPKAGAELAGGLSKSFGPVGAQLVGVLGVGLAASAPMLGATVSAAIVGAAGVGGVVGGLALAAKDPRVKAAGISLGDEVMKTLEEKAKVFINPALQGIGKLRQGFQEIGPDLDKIFKNSAKFVDPLVDGMVSGGKKFVAGFATAVSRAGPIIDEIGNLFDKVGGAGGDFFEKLSEDADASARGFAEFTDVIVETVDQVGNLVMALTKTYGALGQTDDAIDDWRHSLEDALSIDGGPEFDITADGMSNMERKAKEAADANAELAEKTRDAAEAAAAQTGSLKELADELRAQTDPVFALLSAETELGEARTKYNKAVKKYGENSAEARDELNKMASASIDLQAAIGEMGDEFDGTVTPALRANLEAAGFTKKEIAALEREFRDAKKSGQDFSREYRAKAVLSGYPLAMANLKRLKQQADDLAGVYNVTVRQRFLMTGKPATNFDSQYKGFASGGIKGAAGGMVAGDLTWVGERGPELLNLPTGSTVRSSGDSMRMMRDGARAAGGGGEKMTLRADVDPTLDRTLVGILMKALRVEIASGSGNVQQELGRN